MVGFFFLVMLVAALYLLFGANGPFAKNSKEDDASIQTLLEAINSGRCNINFVIGDCPLVIKNDERVVAALPNTILLEPLTVRVRKGNRHHSSLGTGHYARVSWGSSSYTSELAPHEELRQADVGSFIVTDRRIAFMGALKTLAIDLSNIIGVEHLPYGIAIHREGKEHVESFRIAPGLKLPRLEDGKQSAIPFSGLILERVVSQVMAEDRGHRATSAA